MMNDPCKACRWTLGDCLNIVAGDHDGPPYACCGDCDHQPERSEGKQR